MLVLYITIGVLVSLILILFILAMFVHHSAFGKRWDPDGVVTYYSPIDYPDIKEENIGISTKKGILRGKLYFYSKEQYKGILVFSHGMWGSHKAYFQEMEFFARNGYKVLGIDAYGTELSDGKSINGLGNSLLTLDKAINYIKKNYPKEKIYVMGNSRAGYAATNIVKYHKDLSAIVAMSPFLSVAKILKHQFPKLLYPTIPFLILIDAMHCGKYSFANAKKSLKKTPISTLILHSKDDTMVPYLTATGHLQKAICNSKVSFYIVDGKKHNPDYSVEALAYTQAAYEKLNAITNPIDKLEFRRNLDYHKMGELDEKVLRDILDFLKL